MTDLEAVYPEKQLITGFDEGFKPNWFEEFQKRGITVYGNIEQDAGEKVLADYQAVRDSHQFTVVEGSGGIVCPIRYDESEKILLPDIVNALGLSVIIVADAGLGTIHNVVTTAAYIKTLGIEIEGVLLNNYIGDLMQKDNYYMIEELTGLKVIGTVAPNGENIIF